MVVSRGAPRRVPRLAMAAVLQPVAGARPDQDLARPGGPSGPDPGHLGAGPAEPPGRVRRPCMTEPHRMSEGPETVQDGKMTDTRAAAGGMITAIERSGYYPGLVADAVSSAVGAEPVV